jgi:hypothetical protein
MTNEQPHIIKKRKKTNTNILFLVAIYVFFFKYISIVRCVLLFHRQILTKVKVIEREEPELIFLFEMKKNNDLSLHSFF